MTADVALDPIGLIARAAERPDLRLVAIAKMNALLGQALENRIRKPEISPSDSGGCPRSIWADIRGLHDLPRDPQNEIIPRLDMGALIGAWQACLLWAAARVDGVWATYLEYEPASGGHVDALAVHYATGERVVVELKSQYDGAGQIWPCDAKRGNPWNAIQAADYALRVDATRFFVAYVKPPAKLGERMAQFEYSIEQWRNAVLAERARLAPAAAENEPEPDPGQSWLCYTCRYSRCDLNKNRAALSVFAEPEAVLTGADFA